MGGPFLQTQSEREIHQYLLCPGLCSRHWNATVNQTDKQSLSSEDSHSSKMMGWLLAPVTYSFAPVPKLILACIFFLNSSPSFPIHGRFPQNVIWKSTQLKPTLLNPASFPDSLFTCSSKIMLFNPILSPAVSLPALSITPQVPETFP